MFIFINRNGVNVEGSTHKQVVDLIKSGGDCLTLTVISVTQQVCKYTFINYSSEQNAKTNHFYTFRKPRDLNHLKIPGDIHILIIRKNVRYQLGNLFYFVQFRYVFLISLLCPFSVYLIII